MPKPLWLCMISLPSVIFCWKKEKYKTKEEGEAYMDLSFSYFCQAVISNPVMLVTVALTLGVIFVNGWTDAPNAIATCIGTRSMNVRHAIWMSAVFNFLGVLVMTHINSSVASTISNMVDFGGRTDQALVALCAALFSIVVYSVAASIFGIPTSESHSLIAGLSGAAIAVQGGIGGINFNEWVKVLYGLVLSLALGFFVGWVICKGITGRTEVYRRFIPGHGFLQWTEQCRGNGDPSVADDALLHCYGCRNQCGR